MISSTYDSNSYFDSPNQFIILINALINDFTQKVRWEVNKVLLVLIGTILFGLISIIVGIVVVYLYISRKMNDRKKIVITSDNYLKIRNKHNNYNSLLEKLIIRNTKTVPILFKPVFILMNMVESNIRKENENTKKALLSINENSKNIGNFSFVSENEIWDNRPYCAEFLFK